MKQTYFFRRYTQTPLLFTNKWIPSIGSRDQVSIDMGVPSEYFIDSTEFITSKDAKVYIIDSYKQVNRAKLFIRNPEWKYLVPNLFLEDKLVFFVLNWVEKFRNCYISSTKEGFKQLLWQANHSTLDAKFLDLMNDSLNLRNLISRFDPINLIWIGFSVENNVKIKTLKIKWNHSVTGSKVAEDALNNDWHISYIEFSHWDINVTLYDDFRFGFYSDSKYAKGDIEVIDEIIEQYNLLNKTDK